MRTLVLTVVLWLVAGVAWAQNWCIVRTPSLATPLPMGAVSKASSAPGA